MDEGAHDGMSAAATLIVEAAKLLAPERTGALKTSIMQEEPQGSFLTNDLEVVVGAAAEYAVYVEYGTGIHGPKGTPIVPVNAQALQIPVGGGEFIYRRSVKGMKAQPFLVPAMENNSEDISGEIAAAIDLSLGKYGKSMS